MAAGFFNSIIAITTLAGAMPKVFIIILNWCGWRDTVECLNSLKKNRYSNSEILVVDNGSIDESADKLQQYCQQPVSKNNYFSCSFLRNQSNLGFAGGNNTGIEYALKNKADYILLLNNDTLIEENFLVELVKKGEEYSQAGMLGGKIYYYSQPEKIWFAGGKISSCGIRGTHLGLGELDEGQYDQIKETDYLTGCCLLVKRKTIEKIGLMPENYFLYYEDADWCWRARQAGCQCLFIPQAKIWHKCSASAKEGSLSYIYYHSRNGLLLARRNASWPKRMCAYLKSFWLLAKQLIKIAFLGKKREWAKQVMRGIIDFYRSRFGQYERWH